MEKNLPSKISSLIVILVGGLLFIGGCIATVGYLGLPFVGYFE